MVRQSAENRIYGFINNLKTIKKQRRKSLKIILTGCMVGVAFKDQSGKYLKRLKKILPEVDEFLPIENIDFKTLPIRKNKKHAWVPISFGCNNFCSYCIVPYARGREKSRPLNDILNECLQLKNEKYESLTLLGQNVNSYGSDLIKNKKIKPTYVKYLGKYRIPTLFPYLLEQVAKINFKNIDFISSNPWDFSDELIDVISKNKNITRTIHLPVQSGDNRILKKMNRWYTQKEYLDLIKKVKENIPEVKFTTDIIVGFPGETKKQFNKTVDLAKKAGFIKAYISIYSPRPLTLAYKKYKDDVDHKEKERRWRALENLINKPNLKKPLIDL
jgi:tRNA-2-methylthio-N6-dimethylallyladenosine synthase